MTTIQEVDGMLDSIGDLLGELVNRDGNSYKAEVVLAILTMAEAALKSHHPLSVSDSTAIKVVPEGYYSRNVPVSKTMTITVVI